MQVSINSFTLLSYQCGGVALSLICLIAVRVDIQLGQIRSLTGGISTTYMYIEDI